MGDRTNVHLVIRKTDQMHVESLIEARLGGFDKIALCRCKDQTVELAMYDFFEINEGDLAIEAILQKKNIPYSKRWDAGDNFCAGTETFRIDGDGEHKLRVYAENNEGQVPLQDVITAYEQGRIEQFITEMKPLVCTISWAEQEAILESLKAAANAPTDFMLV